MTGFGRGQAEGEGVTVTVELKSVNSRFCEISVRGPRSLAEKEIDLQNRIKQSVSRGRITVHVSVEPEPDGAGVAEINTEAARAYRGLLQQLIQDLKISDDVRLEHILRFPEVVDRSESPEKGMDVVWPIVSAALDEAIRNLCSMRRQEGDAMRIDLLDHLKAIDDELDIVNERAPERVAAARVRMQERVAELVGDERVDRDRLEFEIAVLADKLDVNEEAVRLASHIVLFSEALDSGEPVGRKLNFITQEINREINTIGSKANDSELA
ncbi:MAG: YicC/YloC family endoribonuclease, partial [Rhodothermales bacterium]|nr:YicC/YloC family endoribonuclease [Rhodothermales bacterium]